MKRLLGSPVLVSVLGATAVTLSIALGVLLRLLDPLSSPVIPAEDPYTHMAYVREHLRSGILEPLNPPGGMYPPGLHALLAAVWVFTGVELYEIIRLGPVFFGAIGILGMGLLLWRFMGPVGAAIGALGYAIVPEIVFRTTMMAPTALDMALLPFLFYGLLQLTGGNVRYLALALPITGFLIFSHPWLFGILGIAAVVFVLLVLFLPWRTRHSPAPNAFGLALVLALLAGGLGITMTGCGGSCGPGFGELMPPPLETGWLAPLTILGSIAPAVLLWFRPNLLSGIMAGPARRGLPWWARLITSAAIAAVLLFITLPAVEQGMPDQVNLPRMIGAPILYLSFFALVALPFMASRLSYLAAGLFVPTFPMVMYDLLHSQYWPHRTAVFLGVALVLLLGTAAEFLVRGAVAAAKRLAVVLTRPEGAVRNRGLGAYAVFAVALLGAGALGGTVIAKTPEPYPDGWYRLYPPCEMEAMQTIADKVDERPDAIVVVGDWRTRVVLIALAEDPSRFWLHDAFFSDPEFRGAFLDERRNYHDDAIFVVMDRHAAVNNRHHDLSFLDQPPWHLDGTWCAGMGVPEPRMLLYRTEAHEL